MGNGDLTELQKLAIASDVALARRFSPEQRALGGDLFLGNSYNVTPRVFLSFNPGGGGEYKFKTGLRNINFWDQPNPQDPFWLNCSFFVNAVPGLHEWLGQATV